jgi:hypothetical protein
VGPTVLDLFGLPPDAGAVGKSVAQAARAPA